MVNKFITSFTAGEISPSLFARVDLDKYASGAALLENYYVDYRGGVSTRPGSLFCGTCKFLSANVRLIPFIVSATVAYVLEVGVGYIRFLANGGYLLTGGVPTEVATPYGSGDIAGLKYSQSADVLTFTHPSYLPYNLTQVTTGVFTLTAINTNAPSLTGPVASASQLGGAGTASRYMYAVTSVASDGSESLPSIVTCVGDILNQNTGIVNQITWASVPDSVSYRVYKAGPTPKDVSPVSLTFGFIGETIAQVLMDNNVAPDFSATPAQQNDPFSPGQIAQVVVTANGAGYEPANLVGLTFTGGGGTGAVGYGVTNSAGAILGVFMLDYGKDYTTPPTVTPIGGGAGATFVVTLAALSGTYPYCSTYYQQRKVYGGTNNLPQSLSFSRTGSYDNFNQNQIIEDTDGFSISLAGRQVNYIKSLVPMNTGLIALTSSGAYLITGGGANEAITPTSISALPQASSGANDLPPLVVNYDILYGQNRGNVIRDLAFNFYIQSYTGTDRSILASHLFTNFTLQDWTYSEEPYRLVLATRSDGELLVLTYVPEQQIYAWTHYVTPGTSFLSADHAAYLSVAAIPEGNSNAVYTITSRDVAGVHAYYVERLDTRLWTSLLDSWPLDCALLYSGAPATVLSGLAHLNGLSVYALDQNTGLLQGPYTVVAGSITVGVATSKCIVGLNFSTKLNTMEIDLGEDKLGTTQGRRKNITNLTMRVVNSILKGIKASSNGTAGLFTVNDSSISAAQMTTFYSGDVYANLAGRWLKTGQVYLQQDLPYPHTILGLIPEIIVGDNAQ